MGVEQVTFLASLCSYLSRLRMQKIRKLEVIVAQCLCKIELLTVTGSLSVYNLEHEVF